MRGLEQIPWLYDGLCAVLERTGLAEWRRWLANGARGRTLDVGCGTGRGLCVWAEIIPSCCRSYELFTDNLDR